MTRLAFAGMCAALGERGLLCNGVTDFPNKLSASNELSAIAPTPTPHCLKNQRRVIALRCSSSSSICLGRFIHQKTVRDLRDIYAYGFNLKTVKPKIATNIPNTIRNVLPMRTRFSLAVLQFKMSRRRHGETVN